MTAVARSAPCRGRSSWTAKMLYEDITRTLFAATPRSPDVERIARGSLVGHDGTRRAPDEGPVASPKRCP